MHYSQKSKRLGLPCPAGLALMMAQLIFGMSLSGCASQQIRSPGHAQSRNSAGPDSTGQQQVITEIQGKKLKKSMTYPYLTIKFRQEDTEVEMMLDPKSTNLALDLVRNPDGYLQVAKGDSVLVHDGQAVPSDSLQSEIKGVPFTDKLTDEILDDINLAQRLFYQKRYEDALRILRASLRKKETATAYALGGSIYYVNGDLEGAVRAWENALRINPELDKVRSLIERHTN